MVKEGFLLEEGKPLKAGPEIPLGATRDLVVNPLFNWLAIGAVVAAIFLAP